MVVVTNNVVPTSGSVLTNILISSILCVGFVFILINFGLPILKRLGPGQMDEPGPSVYISEDVHVTVPLNK